MKYRLIINKLEDNTQYCVIMDSSNIELDAVSHLLDHITYPRFKNEGIELIDKVLEGLSEVEYFGINDIEAEIKHNLTTVTNDHFDPPTVDHIETTEFKRLIEEWWKESEKYRNIKKDI